MFKGHSLKNRNTFFKGIFEHPFPVLKVYSFDVPRRFNEKEGILWAIFCKEWESDVWRVFFEFYFCSSKVISTRVGSPNNRSVCFNEFLSMSRAESVKTEKVHSLLTGVAFHGHLPNVVGYHRCFSPEPVSGYNLKQQPVMIMRKLYRPPFRTTQVGRTTTQKSWVWTSDCDSYSFANRTFTRLVMEEQAHSHKKTTTIRILKLTVKSMLKRRHVKSKDCLQT